MNLKIVANGNRDIMAWQGASVIASMDSFMNVRARAPLPLPNPHPTPPPSSLLLSFSPRRRLSHALAVLQTLISQEVYDEEGPEVVHKLNIFALS